MTKKQLNRSWRARKVYWATFVIAMDYVWLFLKSKIFGKSYFDNHSKAVHIRSAHRLRKVFLELRGLFIKIGQLISILSTFLPDEFRKPLEDFQDHAPERPFSEIIKRVEEELKTPWNKHFSKIEEKPLASASIGQVHRATLMTGEEVAVKVQHDHIPQLAHIDLDLFENVNNLVSRIFKIKGMKEVASEVRVMIEEELDYGQEATNMKLMRESIGSAENVIVPKIYEELSTDRLLVSEFCEGVKINNLQQLDAWGIDRQQLTKEVLELCCKMVLKDGLYHADPHPGNILVNEKGQMVWLDFGAIARLHPKMKKGLASLIEGVARQDTDEIVDALKFMGFVNRGGDAEKFAEKMIDAGQEFLENEVKMDGFNFNNIEFDPTSADFSKIINLFSFKDIANTFQVPKDYILLNRMLILIMGLSGELAPQMNPIEVVRPYIKNMMLSDRDHLFSFVKDTIQSNLTNLITLPGEFRKVLNKTKRGNLELKIKSFDDRSNAFYFLGQQFLFGVLAMGAAAFAYDAFKDDFYDVYRWCLGGAGVSVFLFLRAMFLAGRYRKR